MNVLIRQNKVEDKHIIQVRVVANLSKRKILGYPTTSVSKEIIELVLTPDVNRIVNYIYNHKLDYVHFLRTATNEKMKAIANGYKN